MARFPTKEKKNGETKDEDEDEKEARLKAEVEALFDFDEELAADPSFEPREDGEAEVKGEAALDLKEEEQNRILAFTGVAERVVGWFVGEVRAYFPRVVDGEARRFGRAGHGGGEAVVADAVSLPARTKTERRKVIALASLLLDPLVVNSRRLVQGCEPSKFYFSDFAKIHENIFIGDAGGAFCAGPAGFTLVVNCAPL